MRNLLICYYGEYPTRTTILDHLYSFQRYSGHRCFYWDSSVQSLPRHFHQFPFDLIIFHTSFLSARWDLPIYRGIVEKSRPLANHPAVKIALPQDEFFCPSAVCDFINEFGINHVFSVAPPSEWKKIYRTVDFTKVNFHPALTGYLDRHTLARIERAAKKIHQRDLQIGYRARRTEPWLGRHGFLKGELADVFEREALARGIKVDISTRPKATLHGDAWYEFLLRCKYTIGVEGGASILDWDGSIRENASNFLSHHPRATFDDIQTACFPGKEGSLSLFAISPRHLEACATRTCQILVEGEYNGILQPGKHYIELKRDFSNLDEVFSQMQDDDLREKITENAYRDVVESGQYFYESFVSQVLTTSLQNHHNQKPYQSRQNFSLWLIWKVTSLANGFACMKRAFRDLILHPLYQFAFDILPEPLVSQLRAIARKVLKKS